MKQEYSKVEKPGGKHFKAKELFTNTTTFESEHIPNEMRTPPNKDYGSLVDPSLNSRDPNVETKS